MKTLSRIGLAIAGLLLASVPATACNIPVFRYALDHWAADPYRLTLFHRGPLSEATLKMIERLEAETDLDFPVVQLHRIDLDKEPQAARGLPQPPPGSELPWLVVQYPSISRIDAPVWTGPLKDLFAATLLDSPVRREVAKRIRGGDSSVFLLLACGDKTRDEAAEHLLRVELARLEKDLKVPKRTAAPEDQLLDEAGRPLRLAFSVLRVDRADAAEQSLVKMLLNTEEDLPGLTAPMVFPVFGRGRALPALVGDGITADNIEESAAFLVGPCSCQVKRENPGVDLLIRADWGVAVSPAAEPTGLPAIQAGSPVVLPVAAAALPSPATTTTPHVEAAPTEWRKYSLYAGIGTTAFLVLVTGLLLILRGYRSTWR